MTLIVGIRCTDGVVIGTDSAMTFGTPIQRTIAQPARKKIDVIDEQIVVAGTGSAGFGQRFVETIAKLWQERELKDKSTVAIGRIISRSAIQDFAYTHADVGGFGALVAISNGEVAELIEFAETDLQPEVKSNTNWYTSMGSGQPVADPLLGFVRATFWGDDPPNLREGAFAATLVLKLACQMSPIGVAEPIQMAVLYQKPGGQLKAERFTRETLLERQETVKDAIEHFKQYRSKLAAEESPAPTPPAASGA